MSGIKLAALYSFPPARFNLCGMGENSDDDVLYFLLGKKVLGIRKILESFEGALFYYKLIAKESKISDYFNEKVVRSYWIGNELLEKVRIQELKKMIKEKLKKPKLARNLPDFAKAHHSFHVLITGPIKRDLKMTEGMKDLCKISWGRVLKILDNKLEIVNLIVEYQPLLKEKKWFLGNFRKRIIFWDKRILPKLRVADFISFHWDLALEKISKEDTRNLKKYTEISIKIANLLDGL